MKKTFLLSILSMAIAAVAFAQQTQYPSGLLVNDKAPGFSATAADGTVFNLKKELKKGAVVVIFYRGQWCPFCNKQLSMLNDSLAMIKAKGATVIAITPETAENIAKTVAKTKASFPIVEDKAMAIMKKYKVNFAVDENTISKYKGYGIDFNKANGENGANLPVPATYIIGKNGRINYVFFNTDYRQRPSVRELLDHL